jgi:inner membrane protein
MSPVTHVLASWVIAVKTTTNDRDCRLVTLAGLLPDIDGLGLLFDLVNRVFGHQRTLYYDHYHHFLLHGVAGAFGLAVLLACLARDRWRVAMLSLIMVHLHLLLDFIGSRGPTPEDLWPIFYYGPFNKDPMWTWKGQWRLDGWQNKLVFLILFAWTFQLSVKHGKSVVGVFNRRADLAVIKVLRGWHANWLQRIKRMPT